jgi:hypothetical protein
MAIYAPKASGDWSSSATWGTVTEPAAPHATVNTVTSDLTSAAPGFSTAFTAPSTSDAAVACIMYFPAVSATTWTAILQEFNGSTWTDVATGTLDNSDLLGAQTFMRIDLPTPYTYTTTSANRYRWKVYGAAGVRRPHRFAAGGTTDVWVYNVDNRGGVPGTSDQAFLVSDANNQRVVTLDASVTIRGGTATTYGQTLALHRTASIVQYFTDLVIATTGSITLSFRGNWNHHSGAVKYGTASVPGTNAVNIVVDMNGVASSNAIFVFWQAKWLIYADNSRTKGTFYTSGAGTAASPLVVADSTGWQVGDLIVVASGTTNNNTEEKYVRTVSGSDITLSNTAGGAEAGLSNTYDATAAVVNLTCSFKIDSENPGTSINRFIRQHTVPTSGYWAGVAETVFEGVELSSYGNATTAQGMAIGLNASSGTGPWTMRRCSITNIASSSPAMNVSTKDAVLFEDCVWYTAIGTSRRHATFGSVSSQVRMRRNWHIGTNTVGCLLIGATNTVIEDPVFRQVNRDGGASGAAFVMNGCLYNRIINPDIRTTRNAAFFGNISSAELVVEGGVIESDTVVRAGADQLATVLISDATISATGDLVNLTTGAPGSRVTFANLNDSTDDQRTYETYGAKRTTGDGLDDTTAFVSGSKAYALYPQSASVPLTQDFNILASPGQTVYFLAQVGQIGGASAVLRLFLPGSSTPDAEYTMAVSDEWVPVVIAAYYDDSAVPGIARVELEAGGTSGAVYIDSIYNGGNEATALDLFYRGQPAPLMVEGIGDPASIWAYPTLALNVGGSVGEHVMELMQGADHTEPPTAEELTTAILDAANGIETGLTPRQALRLIAAAVAGELEGADSTTITIRNAVADDTNRIVATVDENGNRTAIMYDVD